MSTMQEDTILTGHWFSWGTREQWFRLSKIEDGKWHYDAMINTYGDNPAVQESSGYENFADMRSDGGGAEPVIFPSESDDLPEKVKQALSAQEPKVVMEGKEVDAISLGIEVEALRAENLRLTSEVATLAAQRDTWERDSRMARANHESDIEKIGARLLEECENRRWCEEYDSVVEDLNEALVIPLPTREQEFQITMRVEFLVTKTVTAHNEEAAGEEASEGVDWTDVQYLSPDDVTVID